MRIPVPSTPSTHLIKQEIIDVAQEGPKAARPQETDKDVDMNVGDRTNDKAETEQPDLALADLLQAFQSFFRNSTASKSIGSMEAQISATGKVQNTDYTSRFAMSDTS
ncbi:hypothetical protein NP233_g12979 [Leucocoprinus birnbaumii]|uniref:Uncharacterized protein n=1 Tax=Leucocoprinus birnbaumii TaxID=56174 RepID=A0AAD5VDI4_9AGAR|nr:hypothetical protein NP233_g12979 [Leucocoprinus birnbaumii]